MLSSSSRSVGLPALGLALLCLLALPAAGSAREAHAAKVSAKATCAKVSAGAVSKIAGVQVKRPSVRDNLAYEVGDRTLGFECAYLPAHASEKFPGDENVAEFGVSRTHGTAAKLRKLIKSNPRYAGYSESKLGGIGSLAYLSVQPYGEDSESLPQVTVWVLKGHTIFFAYSNELAQSSVEALAKLGASKF